MKSAADTSSRLDAKARRRVYLWVGFGALMIRALSFSDQIDSAFFGIPILDETYYDALARSLLQGSDPGALNPGFRPWLYGMFLALAYGVGGGYGLPIALGIQHLLGVATCLVVCSLAMDWYRKAAAGWLAGGLYALAGPPLFFEGQLLITTTFTLLTVLVLLLLPRVMATAPRGGAGKPVPGWLAVGALLGLAAQARPNALLLCLAVPWLAWHGTKALSSGDSGRRLGRTAVLSAAAAAGCVAVMAVFAWVQTPWIGAFQWLPQSGGINLYLGNERGADGMQPRQDQWVSYGDVYRDSVQVFAEEVYRQRTGVAEGAVDARTVSSYWRREAWREISADPRRWLALMARKSVYLLSAGEIPNNKSYAFVRRHESTVLPWLPVRWGLLMALAAVGWWALPRAAVEQGQRLAITLYGGLLASGILLFFVNGRYRMPLWPVLAALAAGGVLYLWDAARQRQGRRLLGALAVAGSLWGVAVTVDGALQEAIEPLAYRDFFYRSMAHYEKGQLEDALHDIRRSLAILEATPQKDAAVWFQQGNVALALKDDALAFESYRRAAELTPEEPRIFNNMAILHERRGRFRDAYEGYRFALALADDYTPAMVNLALLELRAGQLATASERLRRAVEAGDRSVPALCGLAFVARARGRLDDAARWVAEARQADGESALRILMELEQPIEPRRLGLAPTPEP